jgi:hypothetical protein
MADTISKATRGGRVGIKWA